MFDINELIEKWDSIGLLEFLPDRVKPNIVLKYELIAMYIVDNEDLIDNVMLTNCIFPMIYRLYYNGKRINDIESFVNEVEEFISENIESIQDLKSVYGFDVEAEMCSLFVQQYISDQKIEIEPIKWINKHKL